MRATERTPMMEALNALRRVWRFTGLPGLRDADGTYGAWPLDSCPGIEHLQLDGLAWLEELPRQTDWTIDRTDDGGEQTTPLSSAALATRPFATVAVPAALKTLAARPDLQRRFRSATGCYLDLGQHPVGTDDGGTLVHFMSDQQWLLHWLIYLDGAGNEAVLTCPEPLGWTLSGEDWPRPPPSHVPLDGSYPLEISADSLSEFLRRFWLENEIYWALRDQRPLPDELATYADRLTS